MIEIPDKIKLLLKYEAVFETLYNWGYEFYNPSCHKLTFADYPYKYIFKVAHIELQLAKTWLAKEYKLDVAVHRKTSGYHGFEIWFWRGKSKGWGRAGSFSSDYEEAGALIEGIEAAIKLIKDNGNKPYPNET